jgi:mRNA interferase RelE/StbE
LGTSSEGTGPVTYEIRFTPTAMQMLRDIKDQRIQKQIAETVKRLAHDPDKQGKPLYDALLGYRSLRVVGQRYRVVYAITQPTTVVVVAIGIRKEGDKRDVYNLATRIVRLALQSQPEPEPAPDDSYPDAEQGPQS